MMSDKFESAGFPLIVEGTTTGECTIFSDLEDSKDEVLYITSDKSSSGCQTDPWYGEHSSYPTIPNIPIFFCARLSPDLATTQCLIPFVVDVALGTNPPPTFTESYSSKLNPTHNFGYIPCEQTEQIPVWKDAIPSLKTADPQPVAEKEKLIWSSTPGSEALAKEQHGVEVSIEPSAATQIRTHVVKVHKKRGRKKKVVVERMDEGAEAKHIPNSQTRTNYANPGKRRRKKKRDLDYEYNMSDSEAELKVNITVDDDDRDKDYKVEKFTYSSEEENLGELDNEKVDVKGEDLDMNVFSENVKDEVENDEDCEAPTIDVPEEYEDMSEEFDCDMDYDDDACNALSPAQTSTSSSKVLKIGINDLNPDDNHARRMMKYRARAKEMYRQEKVVKEDGKVMYRCLKCQEEFMLRMQLKEHKKTHSNKVRMYDCSHCDKVFTEARKYYSHLGFHDRLFECRSCGRRFSLLRNLKKHLTFHHGTPYQVCEVCGNQFVTTEELKLHHETQHNEDSIRSYKIECKHCGRKYVREEAYDQHISKPPYKCSLCDALLGCEYKLKEHVKYEHGHSVCEFCGKSFKKRSLIHHIKVVHKEAGVQCPHCPKKFTYRSKMLAHMDANHTEDKKYKCNVCSYSSRTVNSLNLHCRRRHTHPDSVPSYDCKICGRKFHLPSKLTLHYRIHTREKPYSCGTCNKAFASKYNMTEHERCVHGEKVELLKADGSSQVRVVKHRRTPRAPGRRCDICNITLPSLAAMMTHMKQNHNAQAIPTISLVAEKDGVKKEPQVTEIELNQDNYEPPSEQCEVIENTEQNLILTASSDMVTIPEYATLVEIDGVEYQVLRQ